MHDNFHAHGKHLGASEKEKSATEKEQRRKDAEVFKIGEKMDANLKNMKW